MRLKSNISILSMTLLLFLSIQCQIAVCYKSEIEITPEPIEEPTTKKSGFFSGIKNYFRGSATTTTVSPVAPKFETSTKKNAIIPAAGNGPQKPPPLVISPLMPLGPRPDTPLSGNNQQELQWPQAPSVNSGIPGISPNGPASGRPLPPQPSRPNAPLPNFPAVFGGQHIPPKSQPSGIDLSYGAGAGTRTSTTTTTRRPDQTPMNVDLRGSFINPSTAATTTTTTSKPHQTKQDYPPLPPPRKSSLGSKEDFPALPTPKTTNLGSTTTHKNNLPSAWNSPNIPNSEKFLTPRPINIPSSTSSTTTTTTGSQHGVSFVTHKTTTVRPGFENTGNNLATDNEIMEITENLYTKENSLLSLIRVNEQGKTRSIDSTDEAPQPLLEVNSQNLKSPTVEKMRLLFNNYDADTTSNEHVTANERKEENEFLDAVMATPVMRHTMLFLQNKGIVTPDPKTHRDLVKELWFTQYSRGGGRIGSSGFEHVFAHENKNGTIIGFHNWVYFAEEETAGRMDYKGYLKALDIGTKGKILKVRFTHNKLNKPVNDLFIGTSPELELALYTMCFKLRPDRTCPVSLGNTKFGVVTYSWRYRGKSLIGSAFPQI